jgi:hypothetical protein
MIIEWQAFLLPFYPVDGFRSNPVHFHRYTIIYGANPVYDAPGMNCWMSLQEWQTWESGWASVANTQTAERMDAPEALVGRRFPGGLLPSAYGGLSLISLTSHLRNVGLLFSLESQQTTIACVLAGKSGGRMCARWHVSEMS